MKLSKRHFLYLVGLAVILNSCSVEKRKYMDGYHVQWHHKKTQKIEAPKDVAISTPTTTPNVKPVTQEESLKTSEVPSTATAALETSKATGNKQHLPATYIARQSTIKAFQTLKKVSALGKDEPIINERAQNAKFAAYGLIASTALNAIVTGAAATTTTYLGTVTTVLSAIAFACLIFAFVLGYTAKGEFSDNPNYYKNRKDYVFALTVAWVYTILAIIAVLFLVLLLILILASI